MLGNVEKERAALRVDADRTIRADGGRLSRAFENLYRNAVEHGGPDVTITVGTLTDGFYVADDGPGIPPERRDEVFEIGFSTTRGGTGFGLTIVREIVDAHGWRIDVTSGVDGGARSELSGAEAVDE